MVMTFVSHRITPSLFFVMLANLMLITRTDIVLIVQAPSTVRWPFICSIDHARKK